MVLMTYLSCNILKKLRFPTTGTQGRVQKDSYLNNILMLGDCVGEWLFLEVVLRHRSCKLVKISSFVCKPSWQSVPNLPILWRPLLLPTPLLQIWSKPPSFPENSTPTAFFVTLLIWLNLQLQHIWCVFLVNDIVDIHMSSLGTLVPEEPCCVYYATRC